ncbi:unnamed protein product [Cuscuta epithymum]|uniref:Uncharacterized protein n=1 Tax=Cuscuta epithymum TaxID=186058 RepID=A0AAV0DGP1_9ASTE|nr:unnamed protein product [Cuscuta epithymum]
MLQLVEVNCVSYEDVFVPVDAPTNGDDVAVFDDGSTEKNGVLDCSTPPNIDVAVTDSVPNQVVAAFDTPVVSFRVPNQVVAAFDTPVVSFHAPILVIESPPPLFDFALTVAYPVTCNVALTDCANSAPVAPPIHAPIADGANSDPVAHPNWDISVDAYFYGPNVDDGVTGNHTSAAPTVENSFLDCAKELTTLINVGDEFRETQAPTVHDTDVIVTRDEPRWLPVIRR